MPEMSLADLGLDQVRNFAPPMPEGDLGAGLMGLGRGLKAVGQGIAQQVATPGRLMAPNPWPEGTEQWHWYEDQKSAAAMQWAPEMAVNMIGSPAAVGGMPGTVGSGIKAFHSSPHDFDRFDLSKIGTGEGAQVYGHGLYFAENPAVSGQGGQYWQNFAHQHPEAQAARYLQDRGFDRSKALADAREWMALAEKRGAPAFNPDEARKMVQLLESGKPVGPRTYEVNINADPAHMLDWDKPLSQQSEHVRAALPDIVKSDEMYRARYPHSPMADPFGSNIYTQVGATGGLRIPEAKAQAAAALREAGIPGIKYLDGGSRGPQVVANLGGRPVTPRTPTSNYVIFDPSIVNIMKKYGIVGAAPGSLMALQALQDERQQQQQ